tara:strand:+ start:2510 stop:2716 length:207 start_codon:yes stop_codon:yes gene_type:complete
VQSVKDFGFRVMRGFDPESGIEIELRPFCLQYLTQPRAREKKKPHCVGGVLIMVSVACAKKFRHLLFG